MRKVVEERSENCSLLKYASLPCVNESFYGKISKILRGYEPLVGATGRVYIFNKGALAIDHETNKISVRGKLPEPLCELINSILRKISGR